MISQWYAGCLIDGTMQTQEAKDQAISRFRRGIDIAIALVLMVILLQFAVGNLQSFVVVSRSMDPTLKVGDHVLLLKESEKDDLHGKVVAFEPEDAGSALTKRVIAEDGERVDLREGRLFVNGRPESYARHALRLSRSKSWFVGNNQMFVAGDNRNNSYDSVDHGPVSRNRLLGVLAFRYWPPERLGTVN